MAKIRNRLAGQQEAKRKLPFDCFVFSYIIPFYFEQPCCFEMRILYTSV